jgi:uncharacterized coiled-coil DUF342 family protein
MDNQQSELGDVSRQMRSIQDQIDDNYRKLNKLRDRRNEIFNKFEEFRNTIAKYKALRDEKNQLIAEKKAQRDQFHKQKAEVSDKIKELMEKRKAILSNIDYDENDLFTQLKEISWRYQTTSLSIDEDRKAVQRISNLERKLMVFKKTKDVDQEIGRLRTQFNELKDKANATHSEIIALAEESKTHHEALIKTFNERDTIVAELEQIRKNMSSLKDDIGKSKDELFVTDAHFRVARNTAMQQRADVLTKQAELILNKKSALAEKASEKLKNGGRMTFEEFAAMVETKGIPT